MKLTTVTNYLVEESEFVEEQHIEELRKLLEESTNLQTDLTSFFDNHFPQVSTTAFFARHFHNPQQGRLAILKSFEKTPKKRTVQDFVKHFTVRFKAIERMLKHRNELQGLSSISRIKHKRDREKVAMIGMVQEKSITKNNHIILTLEDLSGSMKVLINKDNVDLMIIGRDVVLDDIIGITGTANGDIVFSDSIIYPDIPLSKPLTKSPYDNYAVFFSDIEFGSKEFMKKEFHKLLLWLNARLGTKEQREIAKKIQYVVITGDVVDGVGIYPGQENDLAIKSVYDQYKDAAYYLSKIPKHMKIIICAGNHDVGRLAEPQLPLPKEFAQPLWDLPNVIMVSNPAYVDLDKTEDFPGIRLLMYHGGSLPYYADAIPSIRAAGGQKCADDLMIALLRRRHMCPAHGAYPYVPDSDEDALIIDPIPDIFVTGHVHRAQTKNYRNVTCINSSCWNEITEDQEKRGLEPQPGRAFVVSLRTREVKVLNFSSGTDATSVAEYNRKKAEQRSS